MPTGYTCEIEKGITFKQFVLNCSRAFGALYHMRDMDNDAPIPTEILPSDYHFKAFKKAKSNLAKYEKMSIKEADRLAEKYYNDSILEDKKYNEDKKKLKLKYLSMLEDVNKWNPPTKEHEGLKSFMIQQINDSIEWDCTPYYSKIKKIDGEQYLLNKKSECLKDIEYHAREYDREVKRCDENTKWIQSLIKSLE